MDEREDCAFCGEVLREDEIKGRWTGPNNNGPVCSGCLRLLRADLVPGQPVEGGAYEVAQTGDAQTPFVMRRIDNGNPPGFTLPELPSRDNITWGERVNFGGVRMVSQERYNDTLARLVDACGANAAFQSQVADLEAENKALKEEIETLKQRGPAAMWAFETETEDVESQR